MIKIKLLNAVYISLVLLSLFLLGCREKSGFVTASGSIYNYESGEVMGSIFVTDQDGIVILELSLIGDDPNRLRAAHIHNGTCEEPLGHWNANSTESYCSYNSLGSIWAKPFAGDIGNLDTDRDGQASLRVSTDLWTLDKGLQSDIDGKIIAIHLLPSDFLGECDPMHEPDHMHNNPKIGCGQIELD